MEHQGGSVFQFMIHDFKEHIDRTVETHGDAGGLIAFLGNAIGQVVVQRLANIFSGEAMPKRRRDTSIFRWSMIVV